MTNVRRLPLPVVENWDWQSQGSCRGMNSDLFFLPERARGKARVEREARAKKVCEGCPVLEQCRAHALTAREPYGVWGGQSVAERRDQIDVEAAATVVIDVDFVRGHHRPSRVPTPGPSLPVPGPR